MRYHNGSILLASFIAAVLHACSPAEQLPQNSMGAAVRAGGLIVTDATTDTKSPLDGLQPVPLSPGSTMWLLIEEPEFPERDRELEPEDIVDWKISDTYPMKSYVVMGEDSSLFPCQVDGNGNMTSRSGSPLMLMNGKYKFHAVSPARALGSNGEMSIKNGQYVIASDRRWTETEPTIVKVDIDPGSNEMQSVELNPLINQTSQIRIRLKCGDNVSKIGILPEGVEVSGIQEDTGTGVSFHWTVDESNLPIMVGNKYHGVKVPEWFEETVGGEKVLTGLVSILPTDATTNSVFITFNISVNDVSTQYMASLNTQYFESARRYTYTFKVSIPDGVTVATWDNVTIVKEEDFSEPDAVQ